MWQFATGWRSTPSPRWRSRPAVMSAASPRAFRPVYRAAAISPMPSPACWWSRRRGGCAAGGSGDRGGDRRGVAGAALVGLVVFLGVRCRLRCSIIVGRAGRGGGRPGPPTPGDGGRAGDRSGTARCRSSAAIVRIAAACRWLSRCSGRSSRSALSTRCTAAPAGHDRPRGRRSSRWLLQDRRRQARRRGVPLLAVLAAAGAAALPGQWAGGARPPWRRSSPPAGWPRPCRSRGREQPPP
jgi:hypothetical protein